MIISEPTIKMGFEYEIILPVGEGYTLENRHIWLTKNIDNRTWAYHTAATDSFRYMFKYEDDAILFKMVWG